MLQYFQLPKEGYRKQRYQQAEFVFFPKKREAISHEIYQYNLLLSKHLCDVELNLFECS